MCFPRYRWCGKLWESNKGEGDRMEAFPMKKIREKERAV